MIIVDVDVVSGRADTTIATSPTRSRITPGLVLRGLSARVDSSVLRVASVMNENSGAIDSDIVCVLDGYCHVVYPGAFYSISEPGNFSNTRGRQERIALLKVDRFDPPSPEHKERMAICRHDKAWASVGVGVN
jgi:hypothetical protein